MINQKYARCLELDKILSMLAEYTCCDTAKNLALSIEPKTDLEDVQREIDRTNDIFQLTVRFGTPTYMTLKNPVGRLKIAQSGGVLSCGDLLSIAAEMSRSSGLFR